MPEGPNLKQGENKLPQFFKTFNIFVMGKNSFDGVYFDRKINGERLDEVSNLGLLALEYDPNREMAAIWLSTPSDKDGEYLVVDLNNYDIAAEKTGEVLNTDPGKVEKLTGGYNVQDIIRACDLIKDLRNATVARRQVA